MKKIFYVVGGIFIFIGMIALFYFYNLPVSIKSIEQTNVVMGDENIYYEKATFDIELSKEIKGISSVLLKDKKGEQEIICSLDTLRGRFLQISVDNTFFNETTYQVLGYTIDDQKVYLKKSIDFKVPMCKPFKICDFLVDQDAKDIDGKIIVKVKLFNPLQVLVNQAEVKIGNEHIMFESEDFTITADDELNYEHLTINIPIHLQNSDFIQLTSLSIEYQDQSLEYTPIEQCIGQINIYQDVEVIDLILPDYIHLESKGFFAKILLKEESVQKINSFIIVVDKEEIEYKIDSKNVGEEHTEYTVYILNPKQEDILDLKIIGLRIDGKVYKVSSLQISIEVRKALDNCVLKSKSTSVMEGTRLAFYLECENISDGVNLFKFSGTFNDQPFDGYNYISYPKQMQESVDFSFIDIHHNIISLMTLPAEKLEDQSYCSFGIDKLYYFFDNQENVYELNQTLWVIPEEVVIVVKDFKMTKDVYDVTKETPTAHLELLLSSSISIEKIVLDVNGILIENVFKNDEGDMKGGTNLFDVVVYKPCADKDFSVKIILIEINGQGTILSIDNFSESVTYTTIP